MESSPKRRKTSGGEKHEAPFDGRLATASRFVLEAEELLKEVRVDYSKAAFGGHADVDTAVFKVREAVDSIEGHEGIPVSIPPTWELSPGMRANRGLTSADLGSDKTSPEEEGQCPLS